MGVSNSPDQPLRAGQSTFSKDILRIELSGPQRDNLSIIDIPGIFRLTTEGVTTKADMAMVGQMVRSYLVEENTIILAIMPAGDIATQDILSVSLISGCIWQMLVEFK
jgi:hypothetical protein